MCLASTVNLGAENEGGDATLAQERARRGKPTLGVAERDQPANRLSITIAYQRRGRLGRDQAVRVGQKANAPLATPSTL
jgi:hypothetical protein